LPLASLPSGLPRNPNVLLIRTHPNPSPSVANSNSPEMFCQFPRIKGKTICNFHKLKISTSENANASVFKSLQIANYNLQFACMPLLCSAEVGKATSKWSGAIF
jgi:hypothetical protein